MNKKYLLQFGLAFTLLYAGIDSFLHPFDWVGYVPTWVQSLGFSQLLALHLHAGVELLLGALLLTGWKLKWVGLLAALDIAVIIIVNGFGRGSFLITFRDVGLVAVGLYLFLADEVRSPQ